MQTLIKSLHAPLCRLSSFLFARKAADESEAFCMHVDMCCWGRGSWDTSGVQKDETHMLH